MKSQSNPADDMFDRSILPDALFEFVVIADTHYMSDVGGRAVEFQSRLRQTRRAETALQLASSLQPAFKTLVSLSSVRTLLTLRINATMKNNAI